MYQIRIFIAVDTDDNEIVTECAEVFREELEKFQQEIPQVAQVEVKVEEI